MDFIINLSFIAFCGALSVSSVLSVSSQSWRAVYFTLLPFAWIVHLAYGAYLTSVGTSPVTVAIIWVCALFWLLAWRRDKDKDDRWKKLRKKLAAKVSVDLDGRLTTVKV